MPAWAQGWRGEVLRGGLDCLGAGAAPGLAQDSAPLHSGGFWGVLLSSAPGLPDVPSWVPAHARVDTAEPQSSSPCRGTGMEACPWEEEPHALVASHKGSFPAA